MSETILQTERLELQTLTDDHFDALYELLSNVNVHRYFPRALDEAESRAFLAKVWQRYRQDGYCFWAVIRKQDSAFIGICGLLKQIIDGQEECEVGYRLLDRYWGQGYGTEAAAGCIQYARTVLGKPSVIALIRDINQPSIRVAEKNGMVFEKETIFRELPHRVYRTTFG
jgi:RimJ/RimL family protein N-acetyltransferase